MNKKRIVIVGENFVGTVMADADSVVNYGTFIVGLWDVFIGAGPNTDSDFIDFLVELPEFEADNEDTPEVITV